MHAIWVFLGLTSATSSWYLFWSGFGGNAFLIIVAVVYNRFTCRPRRPRAVSSPSGHRSHPGACPLGGLLVGQ
jgi:hypothetical protein